MQVVYRQEQESGFILLSMYALALMEPGQAVLPPLPYACWDDSKQNYCILTVTERK